MNNALRLTASLLTLLAACVSHAADSNQTRRVLSIVDVETDDPVAYATWIKQYNEIAKARINVDPYLRVYMSHFDGRPNGRVRAVATAATIPELMRNSELLNNDPAIRENASHLQAIRKTGPRVLYQSVYFDGTTPRNAANYNSLVVVTDEPAYMKAIEDLRRIYDANGFQDVKLSVWRVVAGMTDHTHRVVNATSGPERLAAMLEFGTTHPLMVEWFARAAPLRKVVSNGTSREITLYPPRPEGSPTATQ